MICSLLLKVYKQAMKNLLPTPAKSHYTFNLRDFSRVIQGCLLLKKQSLENKNTLIRLFVHEVFRVFYDRLVDDKDRGWLFELMHTIVKTSFDESFEKVFEHLKQGTKVSEDSKLRYNTCILKKSISIYFCSELLSCSWWRKICEIYCLVTT